MKLRPAAVTMTLATLLMTELISASGLYVAEWRRPGSVLDLFLPAYFAQLDESHRLRFAVRWHDPELGWAPRPEASITETNAAGARWRVRWNADGVRAGSGNTGTPVVGAWGDSFTLCDDVDDEQTWEVALAHELGGAVLNWGVPGYGIDQSVLRFERSLRQGAAPPIVILGVHTDDLPRALGAFRPFYVASTDIPLGFKPVSKVQDGRVQVLPMAWTDPSLDLHALERLAWEVAPHDAHASAMGRSRFPFTWNLTGLLINRLTRSRPTSAWQEPDGMAVARYWVDRFVGSAEAASRVPVILLLPGPTSAPLLEQPYELVARSLRTELPDLLVIDAALELRHPGSFVAPGKGHVSPSGNQRIGRLLADRLSALAPPSP